MERPLIESFYERDENGLYKELYGGIKFYVPEIPNQSEILFYEKPVEGQFWQRYDEPTFNAKNIEWLVDEPEDYDLPVTWAQARRQEFIGQTKTDPYLLDSQGDPKKVNKNFKPDPEYCIEVLNNYRRRELERCNPYGDGVWIMLKGMAVWLTGTNFSYLQYAKADNGYPFLTVPDILSWYHWEYCRDHSIHLGRIEISYRGGGKSNRMAWAMIVETIWNENANTVVQGRSDEDSRAFFQEKVVQFWNNLPDFLKPINDAGTNPTTGIKLSPPARRGKNAGLFAEETKKALNSRLEPKSAGELVLDRSTNRLVVQEELAKLNPTTARAYHRHQVNRQTVWRNQRKRGNIWAATTVEDAAGSLAQFREIWNDSDPQDLTDVGTTKSGLLKYMTSAYDGFCDKYGFPVREEPDEETADFLEKRYNVNARKGGIYFIEAERKAVRDNPDKWRGLVRKYPTTEKEAFMFNEGGGVFNQSILSEAEFKLNNPDFNPTRRIKFIKEGNGEIGWREYDDAPWEVYWLPESDQANNYDRDSYSIYYVDGLRQKSAIPLNNSWLRAGCDPVSHITEFLEDEKKGSDNACVIRTKYNPSLEEEFQNLPVAIYRDRTNNPEDAYEQMLMGLMYYGVAATVETNKDGFRQYLFRQEMMGFIRPKEGTEHSNNPVPGVPSGQKLIDFYTGEIKTDVERNGLRYKHLQLVEEMFKFDPKETKKYDITVALGLSFVGDNQKDENEEQETWDIKNLFG